MQVDLNGKVAVVTGAGRGIGRGIATELARNGAKVLIATRTAETGQAVADELNEAGHTASLLAADLSSREACEKAIAEAVSTYGGLDILVHNAGVFPFTPVADVTDDEFDATLRTNLHSMLWLFQAALPHLGKSGQGRVVAISSVIGNHSSLYGMTSYSASKGGLNGMCRNLAVEAAPHKVTVNIIEPGLIVDDRDPRMDDATEGKIVRYIPAGRSGRPSDIAAATLFFVSEAAEFITGQAIIIDGGMQLPDVSTHAMSERA